MGPRKVIIDTDPGIDDVLAIALALGSEDLDIQLITTVAGNVSLEHCTANALRVLEVFGGAEPPPVHAGCDRPLGQAVTRAGHVHGSDGLGGVSGRYPLQRLQPAESDAIEAILSCIRQHPSEITLIALGPLTNVASGIEVDAEAMALVKEIIAMGGSFGSESNVTAAAEFNFFADPIAARVVVQSGLPVTIVGLNVTHQAVLTQSRFDALLEEFAETNLARQFLHDLTRQYFANAKELRGLDGCYMHDPLAVGAAIDSSLLTTRRYPCDVETDGELTMGSLVVDTRPSADDGASNVEVATGVEVERFLDLFERMVRRACGTGQNR